MSNEEFAAYEFALSANRPENLSSCQEHQHRHADRCYRAFQGKIADINREFGAEKTKDFSLGRITVEGTDDFKGRTVVDFQNEWLNLEIDGEVRCMPPDLIWILDPAAGEPIRTDIVRYGYRGTVLLIPAHEMMRTERGIATFGPHYFGYDRDYIPVERLMESTSR